MLTFDPSRPDFLPYGLRCDQWRAVLMKRPDRHNEIEVNFLEKGSLTYLLAGRKVTVNPNYAMNLFQSAFGTTLFSYLTELRVSSVQRLLITTHDSIATIALNSGFNSISRFNAAFKSICGCSPSAYRATNQASLS